MRDIGIRFVVDDSQKSKLQAMSSAAYSATFDMNKRFATDINHLEYSFNRLGITAAFVGSIAFRQLESQVRNLSGAFGMLGKEFVSVNEKFANLQITIASSLRSFSASQAMVREIVRYTAQSPLPFQQIASVVQSLVAQPQTSSALLRQYMNDGNFGAYGGFFKKNMRTVESMATFRPDQGAEGALYALREFMGGQPRSMARRFDISPRLIQAMSGMTNQQLIDNPDKFLDAVHKLFTNIITPEAVVQSARQPGKLMQNIREQALEAPLLAVGGQFSEKGQSPYQMGLVAVQKLYDRFVAFMSDNFEKFFAPKLQSALIRSGEKVYGAIVTSLEKILSATGNGTGPLTFQRIVDAVTRGMVKVIDFFGDMAQKISQTNIAETTVNALKGLYSFIEKIVSFYDSVGNILNKVTGLGGGGSVLALLATPIVLSNIGTIMNWMVKFVSSILPMAGNFAIGSAQGLMGNISRQRQLNWMNQEFTNSDFRLPGGGPGGRYGGAPGSAYLNALATRAGSAASERDLTNAYQAFLNYNSGVRGGRLNQEASDRMYAIFGENFNRVGASGAAGAAGAAAGGSIASTGASFMRKAGGLVAGAGVAYLAIEGLELVIKGLYSFYEALTRVSSTMEERAKKEESFYSDLNKSVYSAENKTLAAFLGINLPEVKKNGLFAQNEALAIFQRNKGVFPERSTADNIVDFLSSSSDRYDPYTGKLVSRGVSRKDITNRRIESNTGFNLDSFRTTLLKFGEAGILSKNFVDNNYISAGLEDTIEPAVKRFYEELSKIPNVMNRLSDFMEAERTKALENYAADLERGIGATDPRVRNLIKFYAMRKGDASNFHDVQGQLFGQAGVTQAEAMLKQAESFISNPALAEMHTNAEQTFKTRFPLAELTERARQIEAARQTSAGSIDKILGQVSSGEAGLSSVISGLRGAKDTNDPIIKELLKTLDDLEKGKGDGMVSNAERLNALRMRLESLRKDTSPTGIAFAGNYGELAANLLGNLSHLRSLGPEGLSSALGGYDKWLEASGTNIPKFGDIFGGKMPKETDAISRAEGQIQRDTLLLNQFQKYAALGQNSDNPEVKKFARIFGESLVPSMIDALKADSAQLGDAFFDAIQHANEKTGDLRGMNPRVMAQFGGAFRAGGFTDNQSVLLAREMTPTIAGNTQRDQLNRALVKNQISQQGAAAYGNTAALEKLRVEAANLAQELARLDAQTQPSSFMAGFKEAISTSRDELFNFLEMGKSIGQTLKTGLGDALGDIVTSTKYVSAAFRDMASNIAASISRMLANKAVEMFLNMMVSYFGGPAASVSSSIGSSSIPTMSSGQTWTPLANARPTFARGGFVQGGSGIRDDVPSLLTGGEYVINRRAAQSIGYSTLDAINSGAVARFGTGGGVNVPPSNLSMLRPVNVSVTVNNHGGNTTADTKMDENSPQMREFLAGLTNLVDERLLNARRGGGMLNPMNT